jgi:RsiW-degrading membrane proteinase PrsW (M82 family)
MINELISFFGENPIEKFFSLTLACIPVLIWSAIFFYKKDENRKLYFKIFLGGTLTVFPILGLQIGYDKLKKAWELGYIDIFDTRIDITKLIEIIPNIDFVGYLKNGTVNIELTTKVSLWFLIVYAFVGITEEIVKFYIVRYSDKTRPELITTINRSLKFGILSALGFAFAENIFYFYRIWTSLGFEQLLVPFIFRSTFTCCAHMMFSGIFAYYYGISKFSQDYIDLKKWRGQKVGLNDYTTFKNGKIALGLFLAMGLHALFNILLHAGQVLPVMLLVVGMFIFLMYLLNTKTGNLVYILADRHRSTMAKKDEEVVLELIGMWYNEGRYQEVEEICERLLKRDPDNNVVKLFKAKTQDKLEKDDTKKS